MLTTPLPRFGTFGALVEYGIDRRLSAHSTIGATMVVGIPFGVKLRVRFSRFTQTYIFPLQLTDGEVNCILWFLKDFLEAQIAIILYHLI